MIRNMTQTDMGALGTLTEDPTREAIIEKYYNPSKKSSIFDIIMPCRYNRPKQGGGKSKIIEKEGLKVCYLLQIGCLNKV